MSSSARAKALYVLLVDQIREFRNRHWMFTKSYIIQRTTYDIATGGSPILQYLPNNLSVVLKVLEESFDDLEGIAPRSPRLSREAMSVAFARGSPNVKYRFRNVRNIMLISSPADMGRDR